MSKFLIRGGASLRGEIKIGGMKNAATPIIAATLLTREECRIHNVPRISDVERMLDILRSLGAVAEWIGTHDVSINCANVKISALPAAAVKSMRSSVLLLGPLLARFHEVELPEPGGDIIGNRPLDTHLFALEKLGAAIERLTMGGYKLSAKELRGAAIVLPEFSVTATENALMVAALASGETTIKLAAAEPHVQDLVGFLRAMGARIDGEGTHTLRVRGERLLRGAEYTIIPDCIEAGTFAVAAAITKGDVTLRGVNLNHCDSFLLTLKRAGARVFAENDIIKIEPSMAMRSFKAQTLPYPGFPTDLQAPFGLLATQCQGTSLIHDPLYEGRLGYVGELIKMGANAVVCDPHRVLITGPTPLHGREITSFDLRAGATLLLAGLVAEGETIIHEAEIVDRGYERIEERLGALGADIKRI